MKVMTGMDSISVPLNHVKIWTCPADLSSLSAWCCDLWRTVFRRNLCLFPILQVMVALRFDRTSSEALFRLKFQTIFCFRPSYRLGVLHFGFTSFAYEKWRDVTRTRTRATANQSISSCLCWWPLNRNKNYHYHNNGATESMPNMSRGVSALNMSNTSAISMTVMCDHTHSSTCSTQETSSGHWGVWGQNAVGFGCPLVKVLYDWHLRVMMS